MRKTHYRLIIGIILSLHACVIDVANEQSERGPITRDTSPPSGNNTCIDECGTESLSMDLDILEDTGFSEYVDMERSSTDLGLGGLAPDMLSSSTPISCQREISFIRPRNESFYEVQSSVPLRGQVTTISGEPVIGQAVKIVDEYGETLFELTTDTNGIFESEYIGESSGLKQLFAVPVTERGPCQERGELNLFFCGGLVTEDFQEDPIDWTPYGDAIWDPAGWLEMTGVSMNRKGSFYNSVDVISSGFASIEFSITTGGGINGGADGFAFTIVELSSVDQLRSLLDAADAGGGLGYTVGGVYAQPDFLLPGGALTVEIDTWQNEYNGTNQLHTDPTRENHIAITRNADASDHLVWFEVPDVEDLQPHMIRVELLRNRVRVSYDGRQVIEEEAIFTFKGGYMFFSGSTGWATNFHRFDDLRILHACR